MKSNGLIYVCLTAALILSNAVPAAAAEGGKEEASRIWEQAVAAKGGPYAWRVDRPRAD